MSDRSIIFYDSGAEHYKNKRKIYLPSTQKCLCYVKRKRAVFSAGTDGTIFAWNIDKIFSNEFAEAEAEREKKKEKKFDYTQYITESTPWFMGDFVQCMIDLPNINFLATGSYDSLIRLWDLRASSNANPIPDHDDKTVKSTSKASAMNSLKQRNGTTAAID